MSTMGPQPFLRQHLTQCRDLTRLRRDFSIVTQPDYGPDRCGYPPDKYVWIFLDRGYRTSRYFTALIVA